MSKDKIKINDWKPKFKDKPPEPPGPNKWLVLFSLVIAYVTRLVFLSTLLYIGWNVLDTHAVFNLPEAGFVQCIGAFVLLDVLRE